MKLLKKKLGERDHAGNDEARDLFNDAKEHINDAGICSGMGMAAHSLGYIRLAMEKLVQAENRLKKSGSH